MLTSSSLFTALRSDLSNVVNSSVDYQAKAAEMLLNSLFKKFEDEGGGVADAAAVEKFVHVNDMCGRFKFKPMQEWEWMIVGEARALLYQFFRPTSVGNILSDLPKLLDAATAGPGSSIGARGEDFYTKHFDSTLSYTRRSEFLLWLYQHGIQRSGLWTSGEILRQSRYGFRCVEGSRLSCVPKNATISRTICTEPSLNMFFQLGMGKVIEDRLRVYGIDLALQPDKNRELARLGSLRGTYGTIDLSSASDMLSNKMLSYMLPEDVFQQLYNIRSDRTQLPNGESLELNMLSTMGNGYTFPLQTTIFMCVVLAVYRCLGIVPEKGDGLGNWGVFGDDIIVRREAYNITCRILELLGFVVNTDKSFNEGPFRESCGSDWYHGYDVRGVYCKSLKDVGSRFSLINRLLSWSSRHGILLRATVGLLLKNVPVCKVPFLEQEDAGVRVPASESGIPDISGKAVVKYLAYRQLLPRLRYDINGVFVSPKGKSRPRRTNQYGIVVSMLQGSSSLGQISLRASGDPTYQACRRSIHWWDAITRVTIESSQRGCSSIKILSIPAYVPGGWTMWETTVHTHLEIVRR